MPGTAKILSIIIVPAINCWNSSPDMVTTGNRAFFRACLPITTKSLSPLDLAVRT